MLKKAVTTLLVLVAGAIAAVLSNRLQTLLALPAENTARHAVLLALGAVAIALVLYLLEHKHALALNWPWHRYWYLRELERYYATLVSAEAPTLRPVVAGCRSLAGETGIDIVFEQERSDLIHFLHGRLLHPTDPARRYFVAGEAGSGKTLAMFALSYELGRAGTRRMGLGRPIPILLRLGEDPSGLLLERIRRVMRTGTRGRSGKVLAAGLERLIESGRVVFLLDAVDELAPGQRDAVLAEIRELAAPAYRHLPIVLTGRTRYVRPADLGITNLMPLEVQPLDDAAVDRMIASLNTTGLPGHEVRAQLERQGMLATDGLARSPFWLKQMLASGVLEGTPAEILNAAIDRLLEREWHKPSAQRAWRQVLHADDQLPLTKRALGHLALAASTAGRVGQPAPEARRLVRSLLTTELHVPNLAPEDVIGIGRDAQILAYGPRAAGLEPQIVEFRHTLLRDVLTAFVLKLQSELRSDAFIDSHADDQRWWNVLAMLNDLLAPDLGFENHHEHEVLVRAVFGGGGPQRSLLAAALLKPIDDIFSESLFNEIRSDVARRILCGPDNETVSAASYLAHITPDTLFRFLNHLAKANGNGADAALARLLDGVIRADLASANAAAMIGKILDFYELGQRAIEVLIGIGAPVVPQLIAVLHQDSVLARRRAVEALGRIGDKRAVEPVIGLLTAADQGDLLRVIEALGRLGDARAIKPLLSKMKEVDPLKRMTITRGIGQIGAPAINELIELLGDSDTAFQAVSALTTIGKPAVQSLIKALTHRNGNIRQWAAEALGRIGDETAVPALAGAIEADDVLVQMHGIRALAEMGGSGLNALIDLLRKREPTDLRFSMAVSALEAMGPAALEPLMRAAEDESWAVRKGAVEALGHIGDSRVLESLCRRLRDDDNEAVRREAALALGTLGDPRAAEPLKAALQDERGSVWLSATIGLAQLGFDTARTWLLDAMENGFADLEPKDRMVIRRFIAQHMVDMGEERAIAWCERLASEKEIEGTPKAKEEAQSLRQLVDTARQKAASAESSGSPT